MRRISTSDIIYAQCLIDIDVPFECARNMHHIFQHEDTLAKVLEDPTLDKQIKYNIVDKVFDKPIRNFLKVTIDNGMIDNIRAIYNQYKEMYFKDKNKVLCYLTTAAEFSEEQLKKIEQFVIKKYGYEGAEFEISVDKSLIGGFILRVGDTEYDRSIRNSLERMHRNIVKS